MVEQSGLGSVRAVEDAADAFVIATYGRDAAIRMLNARQLHVSLCGPDGVLVTLGNERVARFTF